MKVLRKHRRDAPTSKPKSLATLLAGPAFSSSSFLAVVGFFFFLRCSVLLSSSTTILSVHLKFLVSIGRAYRVHKRSLEFHGQRQLHLLVEI